MNEQIAARQPEPLLRRPAGRDRSARLAAAIGAELLRQQDGIELIASRRTSSPPRCWRRRARVLTNKYAEGYPGRRYYGGCD